MVFSSRDIKRFVFRSTAVVLLFFTLQTCVLALQLTELMFNPSTAMGDDSDLEWVEFYNDESNNINISERNISISGSMLSYGGSELILPQGSFLVIARELYDGSDSDNVSFCNYYPEVCSDDSIMLLDSSFSLSNGGGDISFMNYSESIDVTYSDSWGGDGNGYSLEFLEDWVRESSAIGGTPGRENSVQDIVNDSQPLPPLHNLTNETNSSTFSNNSNSTGDTMNSSINASNTSTNTSTNESITNNSTIGLPSNLCEVFISISTPKITFFDNESVKYDINREVSCIDGGTGCLAQADIIIEYWVDDLFDNIVKAKRNTTSETTRSYSPKISEPDKVLVFKARAYPGCNQSNESQDYTEQIIIIKNSDPEAEDGADSSSTSSTSTSTNTATNPATSAKSSGKITYSLDSIPKEISSNKTFKSRIVARNPTSEFHTLTVWSYVYRGSTSYSGERELNKKTINLPSDSVVTFDMENTADAPDGEYKFKVKIIKDSLKTPYELTTIIHVLNRVESGKEKDEPKSESEIDVEEEEEIIGKFVAAQTHKTDFESFEGLTDEITENSSKLSGVEYLSSSAKARKLTAYITLGVFALLLILLVAKKL